MTEQYTAPGEPGAPDLVQDWQRQSVRDAATVDELERAAETLWLQGRRAGHMTLSREAAKRRRAAGLD